MNILLSVASMVPWSFRFVHLFVDVVVNIGETGSRPDSSQEQQTRNSVHFFQHSL
jgi:hypothetical protein